MGSVDRINSRECEISQAVEVAQTTMLEEAARRGFTRKVLHLHTKIPLTTLKSYEEGTAMPFAAFAKIAAVRNFPNDLLNLMMEVSGKEVCDATSHETDYDDLARAALEYASAHASYRHPESDGGIRLVHTETPSLKMKARALKAAAKKVAA
jgi:hypothetical protein